MQPSQQPSEQPSNLPSGQPSMQPSEQPSIRPSCQPSSLPTMQPSIQPSEQPTSNPSTQPSARPSSQPSMCPSSQPSIQPSTQPSMVPSTQPSSQPSQQVMTHFTHPLYCLWLLLAQVYKDVNPLTLSNHSLYRSRRCVLPCNQALNRASNPLDYQRRSLANSRANNRACVHPLNLVFSQVNRYVHILLLSTTASTGCGFYSPMPTKRLRFLWRDESLLLPVLSTQSHIHTSIHLIPLLFSYHL